MKNKDKKIVIPASKPKRRQEHMPTKVEPNHRKRRGNSPREEKYKTDPDNGF